MNTLAFSQLGRVSYLTFRLSTSFRAKRVDIHHKIKTVSLMHYVQYF